MKRKSTGLALLAIVGLAGRAPSGSMTIQYSYDDAGRLLQANYGGESAIDYVYDANGNLLQRTVTADGEVTYTLIYRAGTGGSVDGLAVVTQQVDRGDSGVPVSAVAEDAGVVFRRWSDGVTDPARADTNVQADLDVTAQFRSAGGADLDWYAARGIAPQGDETSWADVDARPVPDKGTTLREENIADTDPDEPSDRFEILAIDPGPPVTVTFRPGSTGRVYTLRATGDLVSGSWAGVPGVAPRAGEGEAPGRADMLADPNDPPAGPFYRVEVELPD